MKSKWIEYVGKKILLGDFANFEKDVDKLNIEIEQVNAVILNEPPNCVLFLMDGTNTFGTAEIKESFRNAGFKVRKQLKKVAVIGVSGFRVVMVKAIAYYTNVNTELFDDVEAAKAWLVKD